MKVITVIAAVLALVTFSLWKCQSDRPSGPIIRPESRPLDPEPQSSVPVEARKLVMTEDALPAVRDALSTSRNTVFEARSSKDPSLLLQEWSLQTYGVLSDSEVSRIVAGFNTTIAGNEKELAALRARMDWKDPGDLQAEAYRASTIEALRAEIICLQNGKYWTVDRGAKIPDSSPGVLLYFGNPAVIDGRQVDVVIPVIVSEHEMLRNARDYLRAVAEFRAQRILADFDKKAVAERALLMERHTKALEDLLHGPPKDINGTAAEREWRASKIKELLPSAITDRRR